MTPEHIILEIAWLSEKLEEWARDAEELAGTDPEYYHAREIALDDARALTESLISRLKSDIGTMIIA